MSKKAWILILAAALLSRIAPAAAQLAAPDFPLDALTFQEISRTVSLLKQAGLADDQTLFPTITLSEPPKADVLAWRPGQPFARTALVIMRRDGRTTEAVVDLSADRVASHRALPDVQPSIMQDEWARAADAVTSDARWRNAMREAGIDDMSEVTCTPMPAGTFPQESYGGRRILRVTCYDDRHPLSPHASRSIEGILAIVDADTGEVIDVKVEQPVVIPSAISPLPASDPLPAQKPVVNTSPQGTNIAITGNWQVQWQNWSFHLRPDRRSGLIVSLVRFNDRGNGRLIAYQMALAELFVPYMDPGLGWATRNYLDAGELGLGYLVSTLAEGRDCPAQSYYLDMLMPSDRGGMFKADRALCIFERATGNPAWRHYDVTTGETAARPDVELVVRTIPTIGNYDYVIDYVFSSRGTVTVRAGATGIDAVKTVGAKNLASPEAAADTRYGALVAPETVAPYHDHYFAFRLDLDIDGPENSFITERFVPEKAPPASLRTSLWRLQPEVMRTEGPVTGSHHGAGEIWRVINPNRRTGLGYHPGYEIMPEHGTATSLLDPRDPAQRRAAFSKATLWVTRAKPDELYPAGDFPVASLDDGLPRFAADGAAIENQDLVFWYTIGFRHVTRPEDWPILPTMWHGFMLRPYGFFDSDPSAALRPDTAQ
ncbi:hypothetical protein [Rhodoligotrophos defluvii]|uniref:copper amine oxidase n=1 Tax=Rhodoligotrophos defluvii TaxID=2561934 RepID=UPI001484DD49|nr:hypothetical protein [Rhodoligotrophos defluvii]